LYIDAEIAIVTVFCVVQGTPDSPEKESRTALLRQQEKEVGKLCAELTIDKIGSSEGNTVANDTEVDTPQSRGMNRCEKAVLELEMPGNESKFAAVLRRKVKDLMNKV